MFYCSQRFIDTSSTDELKWDIFSPKNGRSCCRAKHASVFVYNTFENIMSEL